MTLDAARANLEWFDRFVKGGVRARGADHGQQPLMHFRVRA